MVTRRSDENLGNLGLCWRNIHRKSIGNPLTWRIFFWMIFWIRDRPPFLQSKIRMRYRNCDVRMVRSWVPIVAINMFSFSLYSKRSWFQWFHFPSGVIKHWKITEVNRGFCRWEHHRSTFGWCSSNPWQWLPEGSPSHNPLKWNMPWGLGRGHFWNSFAFFPCLESSLN